MRAARGRVSCFAVLVLPYCSMKILGVSALYHDSAACLLEDGRIVAAAQEERFTRKKHDASFPTHAVAYCLDEAGCGPGDLDHVVFYDKPLLKFERLLETWIAMAPRGFGMFVKGLPVWLKHKLHIAKALDRGLDGAFEGRFAYVEHHESHAASAFFPSPFEEAAILTLDGVGEWATGSVGRGAGHRIELLETLQFPHSLGLLYSAFTYFCGFRVNSGEYKLMGLAPYGEPKYAERIRSHLMDVAADGSLRLNTKYFGYLSGSRMTNRKFAALFDGPERAPESELTQREMDLAASVQRVTEDIMLACARHAHERTGSENLVMAGGVALNCVGNGRIVREGPFRNVWIQPAAGDAGGALGAAQFVWHQLLGKPRVSGSDASQHGSLLGPSFDDAACAGALLRVGAVFERYDHDAALVETIAALLDEGLVVGHFDGRMEFGPRALGNRSILGDPRSPAMQRQMNRKIKFRESFRPFAPAVLQEEAASWFDVPQGFESPYMLIVAPVHEARRVAGDRRAAGLDRLHELRSQVPAVTHVDDSARIQTVDATRSPRFHAILTAFFQRTGCPILVNTSFNVRGEPIVCTPDDAWRCFMATDMDVLVVGRHLLRKSDQPASSARLRTDHLAQFPLD